MAKVGDIVRFLNSTGGGRVASINGNIANVVDEDGFETPVLLREIVVVSSGENTATKSSVFGPSTKELNIPAKTVSNKSQDIVTQTAKEPEPALQVEETPGGDKLNIVLAFEPENIKELSSTVIDTYLVNDSNYYLFFTYMTRPSDSSEWTTRYAGTVEPNIQLYLGELLRESINEFDYIALQYIAFKNDKPFEAKQPSLVSVKFDNTKFFKLHCYKSNPYFDKEVLVIDFVKDDNAFKEIKIDSDSLEKELKSKVRADKAIRRPVVKHSEKRNNDIIEVDLHIAELVDTTRGLSNADMLNLQVDEFRRVMDSNLKNHGQKIVFIHGKGEGILRQALMKELNYRYKGHLVQDASFREYGYGATQVTIK
ncbi:MAG: DUF2027 domain-containing protein [Muribaculaceae bacterium]|nr:DUF2027 domain-containing protein [Muribaculaceae bacterium]